MNNHPFLLGRCLGNGHVIAGCILPYWSASGARPTAFNMHALSLIEIQKQGVDTNELETLPACFRGPPPEHV